VAVLNERRMRGQAELPRYTPSAADDPAEPFRALWAHPALGEFANERCQSPDRRCKADLSFRISVNRVLTGTG
jgi:hypothetical protein